jgi:hypothetical protein
MTPTSGLWPLCRSRIARHPARDCRLPSETSCRSGTLRPRAVCDSGEAVIIRSMSSVICYRLFDPLHHHHLKSIWGPRQGMYSSGGVRNRITTFPPAIAKSLPASALSCTSRCQTQDPLFLGARAALCPSRLEGSHHGPWGVPLISILGYRERHGGSGIRGRKNIKSTDAHSIEMESQ